MPKAPKQKSKSLIHPNSRKALQLARSTHKHHKKLDKIKEKASKLDGVVKKLLWFQENMDDQITYYDRPILEDLVERYLQRFTDELEQISIIQNVGCRNSTQHHARERAITIAQEHEAMLFNSAGIEIPDLLNAEFVRKFKTWNGEAKSLPKLKLIKFAKAKSNTIVNTSRS
ncbi:translation machinery-associated protein 16-like [Clavelina lepadiformis]|uniref:translation machinery-associated protein 16-like n=1 Tax=Clavelina lepadiformis TaxID=159417 RepID=UPI0040432622